MSAPEDKADEAFLSRWSRRKAAPEPASGAASAAPEQEPTEEERERLIAALPPLDSIGPDVDLKPFLARWVPEDLRNAALRRMWVVDPAIRDAVGDALDYAFDYNAPETIPGFGPLSAGDSAREVVERLFSGRSDASSDDTEAQSSPIIGENVIEAANGEDLKTDQTTLTSNMNETTKSSEEKRQFVLKKHGGALPS